MRESCPGLGQNEWEAALLVCKLILTVPESDPENLGMVLTSVRL